MIEKGYQTNFFCRPDSDLENYFNANDLSHKTAGLKNELDFISAWEIAQYARKNGYNILHLHTAHALSIGLLAKLFLPSLLTIGVRRVDFHIRKNPFSKLKYNTNKLNKLVCISQAIQKIAIDDGIDQQKTEVIHSGIDIHKFDAVKADSSFKESLGIPADHVVIGTVAALVGHKDYPNLLSAAQKVIQHTERVSFLAAGSGARESDIKHLANSLELQNRFHFLGYRNDIGKVLKSMDIFVMSSKEEGLGTSILDAQAIGLPCVGTDAGGIPEIIHDGENGLLIPRQNPEKLADALLKLVARQDLREQYGKKARQTVKNYSKEKTTQKNIDLYQRLIEEQNQ